MDIVIELPGYTHGLLRLGGPRLLTNQGITWQNLQWFVHTMSNALIFLAHLVNNPPML